MITVKKISIIGIVTILFIMGGFYYYNHSDRLEDFDYDRDAQQILEMFEKDWYWLFASSREDVSPGFYLKYKTPTQEQRYFGALKIKVLREHAKVLGFVAYYMHDAVKGQLLWLDVREETRGKGYGYLLAQRAVDEMIKMGAQKIFLWTRVSNIPGQKIYKKLGFKHVLQTPDGYLKLEYAV